MNEVMKIMHTRFIQYRDKAYTVDCVNCNNFISYSVSCCDLNLQLLADVNYDIL